MAPEASPGWKESESPTMTILRNSRLATLVLSCLIVPTQGQAHSGEPETAAAVSRLSADVNRLASPDLAGRRGEGARKASGILLDRFQGLGLAPLFDGHYEQPVFNRKGRQIGRNIGAVLPGRDPAVKDEWILLSAHFDHLGIRDGVVYPGADDNASGVAAVLEAARSLSRLAESRGFRRSIVFVGFDLEEQGLVGSRYFVENPPLPLSGLKLFVTVDMLAGSLGGVCDSNLFAMGTEHAPSLRPWVVEAANGLPIDLGVVGSDLLFFDRSDYGPFRHRKIPYLFLSSGQSPVYHTPDDVPEALDYRKLHAATQILERVVARTADAATDALPTWSGEPRHEIGEAAALRDVLEKLVSEKAQVAMKPFMRRLLEAQVAVIDSALIRGAMTAEERRRLVVNVQIVLYTVL